MSSSLTPDDREPEGQDGNPIPDSSGKESEHGHRSGDAKSSGKIPPGNASSAESAGELASVSNSQQKVKSKRVPIEIAEKERKRASIKGVVIGSVATLIAALLTAAVSLMIFDKEGPELGVYAMQSGYSANVTVDPISGQPSMTGGNAKLYVILVNAGRSETTIISVELEGDETQTMKMCGSARDIAIAPSASAVVAFESGSNVFFVPKSVRVTYSDGRTESIDVTVPETASTIIEAQKDSIKAVDMLCG